MDTNDLAIAILKDDVMEEETDNPPVLQSNC